MKSVCHCNRFHRQLGLTIIELLLAMMVFAVLAGIALPNLQNLRVSADLRSTSTELLASISTARSQAVTLRVDVELVPRPGGWSNGWEMVYVWPAGAEEIEDDVLIARPGTVAIDGPAGAVTFQSSGIVSNGAVSFDLCRGGNGRQINVTPLGRVTVQEVSC